MSPSPASMAPHLAALRRCWHPAAYEHEVTERPHATTVLGERLVLWRDSQRVVHAFRDACVHRGTALSRGRVAVDEIVCPYHGWRYRGDGTCSAIPQLEDPTRVPAKAQVTTYRSQERYGLVWVALDDPRWALPDVPDLEAAGWRTVRTGPFVWRCDASRQIENFTDFGHFAFVHEGLLGDPAQAVVAPYTVHSVGHVLRYDYVRPDAPNTEDFPVFAAEERKAPTRTTRYALHVPYTIVEHIDWGAEERLVYFFTSQPVTEERCVGYCLVARNYNLDQPDNVMQAFERTIFGQDQQVVESQRPEQVPFDLADELHLKFDALAVAYRRAMQAHGFAPSF